MKMRSWGRYSGAASLVGLATLAACSSSSGVGAPGYDERPTGRTSSAVFTDGDFESATPGTVPAGWTETNNLNSRGIVVATPETFADLQLQPGGINRTTTLNSAGGALSQTDPNLGAGASLRWPRYGNNCAIVNQNGNARNVNSLSQQMVVAAGDVDPADGLVHIRFVYAPVLQNPGHSAAQQPYYYVQLTNDTAGTLLYSDFNLSGQAGVPWKTVVGGGGVTIDYVDWTLADIAPGNAKLKIGDSVTLTFIAAGCQPGAHYGYVYVDGVGSSIPGLFISGSGPAQANPGTNITYNLYIKNGSGASETGVTFDVTTPPNTTFQSFTPPLGATCTTPVVGGTGTIHCTFSAAVPAGATDTFSLVVQINAGATGQAVLGTYSVQSSTETPLNGNKIVTQIGCAKDADCASGQWCNESANACTPTLANGTAMPTDPLHTAPTLNGACTALAASLVCTAGVCDTDNKCGYLNGDGSCSGATAAKVCRSAVCDPDGKCGYANGDGSCDSTTAKTVCRSLVCDKDGKCGYATGDGPCDATSAKTVCRSGTCSTTGVCEPAGGCIVDADCSAGNWCMESTHTCTAKLTNGTAMPTDPPHKLPTLDGTCSGTAASLVCVSAVCDTKDAKCGYANGDGSCDATTAKTVCRSGVCDLDGKCGYANGDGPCDATTGKTVCRSAACDPDGKCGYATGDGPCDATSGPIVCRSGACSVSGFCEPAGGCDVDADCSAGNWCMESTHTCTPKLSNGTAMPTDGPHTSPTLNGKCSTDAAKVVCVSGVCDAKDDKCGYANGDGSCDATSGAVVCRSTHCPTTGPNANKCEACAADADCSGSTPACDTTSTNTCVQCTATNSSACTGATPVCDTTKDTCGPCTGDSGDTTSAPCPSSAPYCFGSGATKGSCGKCATNADCTGHAGGPICDTTTGACTKNCKSDADCDTATQWCNAPAGGSGTCTPKLDNGTPLPSSPTDVSTCSDKVGTRVCKSGACDPVDNKCGLANGDGPCTSATVCRSAACDKDGKCGYAAGDGPCATSDQCRSGTCTSSSVCGCATTDCGDAGADAGADASAADTGDDASAADAGQDAPAPDLFVKGGGLGCSVTHSSEESGALAGFAGIGLAAALMARRRRNAR